MVSGFPHHSDQPFQNMSHLSPSLYRGGQGHTTRCCVQQCSLVIFAMALALCFGPGQPMEFLPALRAFSDWQGAHNLTSHIMLQRLLKYHQETSDPQMIHIDPQYPKISKGYSFSKAGLRCGPCSFEALQLLQEAKAAQLDQAKGLKVPRCYDFPK